MIAYLVRRLLGMLVVIWLILTVTFTITYLIPGDPARAIAGPRANAATLAQIRHNLGLDRPVFFNLRGSWATATVAVAILYAEPASAQGTPVGLLLQGETLGITDRRAEQGQDWVRLSVDPDVPVWINQEKLAEVKQQFGLLPVEGEAPPPGAPGDWVRVELRQGGLEGWALAGQFQLGYNPFDSQYFRYLWRLVSSLDLGTSNQPGKGPVTQIILRRLPSTAALAVSGVVVELLIGIPVGVISAVWQRSVWDRLAMFLALFGVSAPSFWLGLVLIYFVAYRWSILPLPPFPGSGDYSPIHLVLPAITLGMAGGAWYARMLRSSMLEILQADYVRTARAKGLAGWKVLYRHVMRNAIRPIVTMVGMDLAYYLGGVVLIEVVFSRPGIGYEMWQAIKNLDTPVIVGTITFAAVAIVVMNLVVDLLYLVLDPRVRLA
jgi:peptide/nickel transport system permease protein